MKLAELRIGNWVRTATPGSEILLPCVDMEVTGIDVFTGVTFNNLDPHNNAGFSIDVRHVVVIPLSIEWLLRFQLYVSDVYYISNNSHLQITTSDGKFYADYRFEPLREILYVHELQNLLFAIEGEEIRITSKPVKL